MVDVLRLLPNICCNKIQFKGKTVGILGQTHKQPLKQVSPSWVDGSTWSPWIQRLFSEQFSPKLEFFNTSIFWGTPLASPRTLARWNLPDSADGTVKRINIILRELRWIYRLNMIQNRFQVRCFACATATVTSIFSELQTRLKIFGICDMQLCTEIASFYLSVPHHIIPFINPYIMYPNLSRPVARQCSLAVASLTWVGLHAFHRAALRPIGHTCCVKACSMPGLNFICMCAML